jgi:hypothetical protein
MTYTSCPTTIVNAPIEIVWALLTEPAAWGAFFNVRITDLQPTGSAVVGQRFYGESGPRFLQLRLKFNSLKSAQQNTSLRSVAVENNRS